MMRDTHNKLITFGKHEGERWTRLPLSYLRYLANEHQGEAREMAESELARRGTSAGGDMEVSGHSIDRASQFVPVQEWRERGLYSWLYEKATFAYTLTQRSNGDEKVVHDGIAFVFKHGNSYPILKTVHAVL
jgi:hypothetical protein